MADSPTARTLRELRRLGYLAAVTERWNPHAGIRQDLFGIIDVLAIGPPMVTRITYRETLAVQACIGSDVANRVAKLEASTALPWILEAQWILEVWGWRKLARPRVHWEVRRVRVGLPALALAVSEPPGPR